MTSPGTDLTPYDGGQVDAYRPQIMTPEAARALDENLRRCTKAVLRDGTDYGAIPGTRERKFLFKPGAEKLLQWFGLAYSMHCIDTQHDDDGRRQGVTYRCTVAKRLPDGTAAEIATCEGYAGYDEEKFYQSAEQAQRKAEANERHWAAIDKRPANPTKWKTLGEYRAPWNTVVKMAQKRALVGATINATAAGGLFAEEDNSSDAPADGGPSYYQQALADAYDVTSTEAANELWMQAVEAANSGVITPGQKTHIQNRIKQRVKQLESHGQVDLEPAGDVPPADSGAPAAAESAAPPAEPAGGTPKNDPAWRIVKQFERLGVTDRNDRLILTAQIARLDDVPESTAKLSEDRQRDVLKTLTKCRDLDALNALLATGEQDAEAEAPDEPQ